MESSAEPLSRRLNRALAAPAAPAALVAMWGFLVFVVQTHPIVPYAAGSWPPGDLLIVALIGVVAGWTTTPTAGVVGVVIGLAAAAALQLHVLAGQAAWSPLVVAEVSEPPWSGEVWSALLVAIGAMALGSLAGSVGRRWLRPKADVRFETSSGRSGALAVPGVLVVVGVLMLVLVTDAAHSAYVPPIGEPRIRVVVEAGRIADVTPRALPAGRAGFEVVATGSGDLSVGLTYGLTAVEQAQIATGRTNLGYGFVVPIGWDPGYLPRTDLADPGVHAVVLFKTDSGEPAPDGSLPIVDARFFEVLPPAPDPSHATPPMVLVGAGAGLLVAALAAAGTVLGVRRRRWSGLGRPRPRDNTLALVAGALNAGLLWLMVILAIDLVHNPF